MEIYEFSKTELVEIIRKSYTRGCEGYLDLCGLAVDEIMTECENNKKPDILKVHFEDEVNYVTYSDENTAWGRKMEIIPDQYGGTAAPVDADWYM